jgi:hypothetical protein
MEKIINKFLDEMVGREVICYRGPFGSHKYYLASRVTKEVIVSFIVKPSTGRITLFRGYKLCKTVSSLFSIDEDQSSRYIRNWFGDRHELKKVKDVLTFIPDHDYGQ